MRFLTVCVNYNSDDDTVKFVESLLGLDGYEDGAVVVVMNSGDPEQENSRLRCLASLTQVSLEYPEANLGYFRGAQWGIERFRLEHELPTWIVVSNVDIQFPDQRLLIALVERHGSDGSLGAVAPNIELRRSGGLPSTGRYQNPYMTHRPEVWKMRLLSWALGSYARRTAYATASAIRRAAQYYRPKSAPSRAMDVYAPFGAFVILHRELFDRGGTLSDSPFLFGEEIFLAEMLARLDLRAVFDPELKVVHSEHGSTRFLPSRDLLRYERSSIRHLTDTYFGR